MDTITAAPAEQTAEQAAPAADVQQTTAPAVQEKADEARSYTQEEIDRIVEQRLARERAKGEKKAAEATAEKQNELKALQEQLKQVQAELLDRDAKAQLKKLRVKDERADALLKLADLSEVRALAGDKQKEALEKALTDLAAAYPEFVEPEKKPASSPRTGYIKAGVKPADLAKEDELLQQMRKQFGLIK